MGSFQLVNFSTVTHQVEFAGIILAKGGNGLLIAPDLHPGLQLWTLKRQAPNALTSIVPVNIVAIQSRKSFAAVDISAGHAKAIRAAVVQHRIDEALGPCIPFEGVASLLDVPSVISALFDHVDFFPF